MAALEVAAEMMQVPPEDLGQAITSKTMGGGVIEVFIKPLEARQVLAPCCIVDCCEPSQLGADS